MIDMWNTKCPVWHMLIRYDIFTVSLIVTMEHKYVHFLCVTSKSASLQALLSAAWIVLI